MPKTKVCTKCKIEQDLSNFHKKKRSKDGLQSWCKKCSNVRNRKYYKKYYQNNKEKIRRRKSDWRAVNKEWTRKYERKLRKENIQFRLSRILRSRLWEAIKGHKVGSAVNDLGCSIKFLKEYLESQFQPGMSWDNYGEWHIDHIKPLASFDLTDREQFLEACHYTNLQPLWASDNLSKGAKYDD